jgi:vacuolar iron transporter family protein
MTQAPTPYRIFNYDYISEFVYGGIDGAITTFAVVAGAAGAGAELYWVLIFGFANLIADGFSMSVGNYFSVKAARDNYAKYKAIELWEVEHKTAEEIEEIRTIFAAKGFEGELLNQVVEVVTANKDVWVDTMMKEELKMSLDEKTPVKTAFATFVSFNLIGLIPLLAYLFAALFKFKTDNLFLISCISTGFALMIIGYLRSIVTEKNWVRGVLETLALGGIAAVLAYLAGDILSSIFWANN